MHIQHKKIPPSIKQYVNNYIIIIIDRSIASTLFWSILLSLWNKQILKYYLILVIHIQYIVLEGLS